MNDLTRFHDITKVDCKNPPLVLSYIKQLISRLVSHNLTHDEMLRPGTTRCQLQSWLISVLTPSKSQDNQANGTGFFTMPFQRTTRGPCGPLSLTWVQWRRQKFDIRMEPKTTKLHPTCFKIAMHSVCCCSLLG